MGFRLNHFSVQGNHIHLIGEARDRVALARGVQGLEIRIAKKLNRLMQRRGRVFDDRYHAHILRTSNEVRNALNYVLRNIHKHSAEYGKPVDKEYRDPYSSIARDATGPPEVVEPGTWLLGTACRRILVR